MKKDIDISIIGGSGFYKFLKKSELVEINTPYGKPSDKITIGEYKGRKIAFIPRHGSRHQLPPHKIPFRANIFAMKKLGVKRIIAPAATGSLVKKFKPGDFVICDQFINLTHQRDETFYPGPKTIHISTADPYCPQMRETAARCCQNLKLSFHKKGAVLIIEGPRFSTKAESKWFSKIGAQIVNMTQYPEVALAREMEICYLNVSIVTDYDAGLKGEKGIKPVSIKEVIEMFERNIQSLQKLIFKIIEQTPNKRKCLCSTALKDAAI